MSFTFMYAVCVCMDGGKVEEERQVTRQRQVALFILLHVLTRCGGADCGMSAEGLAVLATQGVAKISSLSSLSLRGKIGVCERGCMARGAVAVWQCVAGRSEEARSGPKQRSASLLPDF